MIVCFRWLRNGHTIGGQTRSYLDIAQISSDYHQNTITCEATNIIGSTVAEITLDILCESQSLWYMNQVLPILLPDAMHSLSDLQINLILYSRECVIKVSGNLTGSPCQADQWLMADGHRRPVSRSLLQSYIYVPQDTATSTDSIGGNQTRLKHAHSASRISFHTYFTSPLSMLSILICHKIFAVFWMHCNGGFVFCVLKHADHSQWITS